jgi:hypothetical protein
MRRNVILSSRIKVIWVVPPPSAKLFCSIPPASWNDEHSVVLSHFVIPEFSFRISEFRLTAGPNQLYSDEVPFHSEGRLAIVTNAGRDAMDAGGEDDSAMLADGKKSMWS